MSSIFDASLREIRSRVIYDPPSAAEIARAFRRQARAINAATHAFITVAEDEMGLDKPRLTGPLAGIPYACKDVFETKSLRTTAGSRVLADNRPSHDAAAVEQLGDAGAMLVGKSNMHEFCYGITGENSVYGTPANPHDASRIAGGSSSGSASSTAMGTSIFSLGSDTGGSIRVPAALCGLIGMKPTYGLVSSRGMIPFCWTLDHVGFMARSSLDAAVVLDVLAGLSGDGRADGSTRLERGLVANASAMLKGLKIGIPRKHFFERLDPEIEEATERVLRLCQDLGGTLIEIATPDMTHVRPASLAIQLAEAVTVHQPNLQKNADLYGEDVLTGMVQGQFIMAGHYVQSLRLMEIKRREYAQIFQDVDVLVTPTTPIVAPKIGATSIVLDGEEELIGNVLTRNTCPFNLTGNPALTLPCGRHSSGLPMGVQIVGRPFADACLLGVAYALEMAGGIGWMKP